MLLLSTNLLQLCLVLHRRTFLISHQRMRHTATPWRVCSGFCAASSRRTMSYWCWAKFPVEGLKLLIVGRYLLYHNIYNISCNLYMFFCISFLSCSTSLTWIYEFLKVAIKGEATNDAGALFDLCEFYAGRRSFFLSFLCSDVSFHRFQDDLAELQFQMV